MNIKIRTLRFNEANKNNILLKRLKHLTLRGFSSMKTETLKLQELCKLRKPDGYVFTASINQRIVGWALLHFETKKPYNDRGIFQIYLLPSFRRKGIGNKLIKKASNILIKNNKTAWIMPYDTLSTSFYNSIESNLFINFYKYSNKIVF